MAQASPVPTQITLESEGATAMAPIAATGSLSKLGPRRYRRRWFSKHRRRRRLRSTCSDRRERRQSRRHGFLRAARQSENGTFLHRRGGWEVVVHRLKKRNRPERRATSPTWPIDNRMMQRAFVRSSFVANRISAAGILRIYVGDGNR